MKLSLPKFKKPSLGKLKLSPALKKTSEIQGKTVKAVKEKLEIQKVGVKEKTLAAVSYLFVAGLVIRLLKKNPSTFLDYHERQSIILFIFFTLFLLIPQYGFTVFAPLVFLLMIANLITASLGGRIRLMPS